MLGMVGTPAPLEVPQRALAIARDIGDTGLLLRALTACGCTAAFDAEIARPYLSEAAAVARESDDRWRLVHVLWWLSYTAIHDGDPRAAHEAGREGRDIAEEIGDRFLSRVCRFWGFGTAYFMQGRLAEAAAELRAVCADAEADDDVLTRVACLCHLGYTLAWLGDADAGRAAAGSAVQAASEIGGLLEGLAYAPLATAALAAGDVEAAMTAASAAARILETQPGIRNIQLNPIADVLLVRGDYAKAMDFADRAVSVSAGCGHAAALMSRARIWTTQGDTERAERDMREALTVAAEVDAHLVTPDVLECLAGLVGESGSHREAARLFGAAETVRHVIGVVRFTVWEDGYAAAVGRVREALGDNDFEQSWSEGTALSTSEAIAYALRGHGARKRPTAGWNALTPAERDVVRLLTEGLANKDIAARLFVSPRTVQSHLTHVYNKLGVSSRVQLVQEAARRN
jgi:DNA-binding CsgD family transcriptional regulator